MRQSGSKKLAKAKADKYFSLYIRERDKDKPCVTCGKHKSEKDCGHFISRRFEATRYDEQNAHGQCIACNRFEYGNQYAHGKRIDQLHGEGTADKLFQKSQMMCKRSKIDYEWIAEQYKNKLKIIS